VNATWLKIWFDAAKRTGLNVDDVRNAAELLAKYERETIDRLTNACKHRDRDTGEHIVRIGLFAGRIAEALGLSRAEQELLRLAAPLHDIGKIATPDHILQKTGPLTDDEWTVMKAHTTEGYAILRDSHSELLQKAAEIALSHHEKFDGSGYPSGLKGDQIPMSARITALCDVFDALLSWRSYKKPWPLPTATIYIEEQAGHHFDPRVVAAFKRALPDLLAIREQNSTDVTYEGQESAILAVMQA